MLRVCPCSCSLVCGCKYSIISLLSRVRALTEKHPTASQGHASTIFILVTQTTSVSFSQHPSRPRVRDPRLTVQCHHLRTTTWSQQLLTWWSLHEFPLNFWCLEKLLTAQSGPLLEPLHQGPDSLQNHLENMLVSLISNLLRFLDHTTSIDLHRNKLGRHGGHTHWSSSPHGKAWVIFIWHLISSRVVTSGSLHTKAASSRSPATSPLLSPHSAPAASLACHYSTWRSKWLSEGDGSYKHIFINFHKSNMLHQLWDFFYSPIIFFNLYN